MRVSIWWAGHPRAQFAAAVAAFTAGVLLFAMFVVFLHYDRRANRYDLSQVSRMPLRTTVYDARGDVVGYLHGDGRQIVPIHNVSENFRKALVAREDSRFFEHGGVDYWALIRASLRNAKDGFVVQGASTLTMQLARNVYDMQERSMERKMVEIALARRIEKEYTKDQILAFYVNRIFFGSGLYGIEQAARGYFGKSAADLDLAESAMIAGIIRAPNRFSPFRHYEQALLEMQATLERMVREGALARETAERAGKSRPEVLPQENGFRIARETGQFTEEGYVLEAIRQEVARQLTREQLDAGGFEVFTTFDLQLQAAAERAVEQHLGELEQIDGYPHPIFSAFQARFDAESSLEPDYLQAAVSVIENDSGAIRAMVGGRDFSHSRFNRATQGNRQIGSIFKPLVYATAFETGLFPGTFVSDNPIRPREIAWDRSDWSPKNSDGQYLGLQPAQRGLIESRNTMSVRVGERAGIDAVLAMTGHAGIARPSETRHTPQVYIGNLGANLQSLVSAYSAFPNRGNRSEPFFLECIRNRDGKVVFQRQPHHYRVVSEGSAWLMSRLLQRALEPGGTGSPVRRLGFEAPAGGKTGTTNDFYDAWFVGFTSRLSGGVWVGLDQPEKIVDRGYGGRIALPIWTGIMRAAQDMGYEFGPLPEADDVMNVDLCRYSGNLAGETCQEMGCVYREAVPSALIPREICRMHQRVDYTKSETGSGPKGILARLRSWLGD